MLTTINVYKKFQVSGAEGSEYSFTSTGNVTFKEQTGIVPSSGVIEVLISYNSKDDFSSPIELKIAKENVCTQTYTFIESSPCNSLSANITKSDFTFTANAAGGKQAYSYLWSYDTTLFKQTYVTASTLTLELRDGVSVPPSSSISLTVKDENDCEVYVSYSFDIDGSYIGNRSVYAKCLNSVSVSSCGFETTQWVNVLFDQELELDLEKAQLSYNKDNLCISPIENGFLIQVVDTSETQTITARIPNTSGVFSEEFKITVFTQQCTTVQTDDPIISNIGVFNSLGQDTNVAIADFAENINPESFYFIASTGQVKVSDFELTGKRGSYKYMNGIISYTDTGGTDTQEIVRFSLTNPSGNVRKVGSLINNFEALPAPVMVDGTICTSCDQTISNISIEPLVTGDFDKSSVEIITAPTNTIVTINDNGTLNFTENTEFDVHDPMEIRVANSDGVVSNTATLNIIRTCAGKGGNIVKNITCIPKSFNLLDVLTDATDYYVGGYSWQEITPGATTYVGQGGVLGTFTTGSVDFTSITPGTYIFKLGETLTCNAYSAAALATAPSEPTDPTVLTQSTSSSSIVTIIHNIEESITIDTVTELVIGTTNEITVNYTIDNYASLIDFKVLINAVEVTLTSNIINEFGAGVLKFTLDDVSSYTLQLQMVSKCNTLVSDSYVK